MQLGYSIRVASNFNERQKMKIKKIFKGSYEIKLNGLTYTVESGEVADLADKKEWLLVCGEFGDEEYYRDIFPSKKASIESLSAKGGVK